MFAPDLYDVLGVPKDVSQQAMIEHYLATRTNDFYRFFAICLLLDDDVRSLYDSLDIGRALCVNNLSLVDIMRLYCFGIQKIGGNKRGKKGKKITLPKDYSGIQSFINMNSGRKFCMACKDRACLAFDLQSELAKTDGYFADEATMALFLKKLAYPKTDGLKSVSTNSCDGSSTSFELVD